MPKRSLESLGALLKRERGNQKLRETAEKIGISAATLMRIENGRMPDLTTFGLVCRWLKMDPGDFLGAPKSERREGSERLMVHFRAEREPKKETAKALANMILLAAQMQESK
ncbi:helix-turn-helix domain-containing protein [Elusimicrobiota bacterium]